MTTDREALAELVALKDLKRDIAASTVCAIDPEGYALVDRLTAEYERRKPLAWAAARARLALPEAVPPRPEFIVSALGDRVFDGDEWYEELLADWRRKYVPNPPSAPQINAPALPIAALSDDQIDDISELAWFNAENETARHGTEDEKGDWSAETEWLRYGRHLARAIVDQINALAGTPALPSREVTGSPGAPVMKDCSICRGTGREGIPGKHCSWCDGTGKFMRGRALAEALGSDGQGNRASQQPPSSRGTATSQPASSAEEDESLG